MRIKVTATGLGVCNLPWGPTLSSVGQTATFDLSDAVINGENPEGGHNKRDFDMWAAIQKDVAAGLLTKAIGASTNAALGHPSFVNYGAIVTKSTTGAIAQATMNVATPQKISVIAAQPDVPRCVTLTITDSNASITAYNISVVGKLANGVAATETFVFAQGLTPTGKVPFALLTSVIVNSQVGAAAADKLDVGYADIIGLPMPYGATITQVTKAVETGVDKTVGTVDSVNGTVVTASASNSTLLFSWFYNTDRA